jgi:hypothetical protein
MLIRVGQEDVDAGLRGEKEDLNLLKFSLNLIN